MKRILIIALALLFAIVLLVKVVIAANLVAIGLTALKSNLEYHKKIHTYEEALEFARSLDPQATISQSYTETFVSEEIIYGQTHFREWDAIIHGVECHVATICCNDPVGEFYKRTYYRLDTDYDHHVFKKIVAEKCPDWIIGDTVHAKYREDNSLVALIPQEEIKAFTNDELESIWNAAYTLYVKYCTYPTNKAAKFAVNDPTVYSNLNGEQKHLRITHNYITDFSAEAKAAFWEEYARDWALIDSGLEIRD